MCGLVGVYGDGFYKNKEIFEELLYLNYLRGSHSTGVAFLNDKYVQIVKDVVSPEELATYKRYKKGMDKTDHVGLMGHGRHATRGSATEANAHPFKHGSITLTHNGTCSHVGPLPGKFDTDSETICHAINEWGPIKTWDKLEYCNPGTVVFWDAKAKTLNMITNGSRPMFFSFLKDRKAIVYASEDWMYKGVCERNNVDIEKDERGLSTYFLKKDHLYTFKFDKAKKVVGFTVTEVKFTKTAYIPHYSGQRGAPFQTSHMQNNRHDYNWNTGTRKEENPLVTGPIARINLDKFKDKIGALVHGLSPNQFHEQYTHCMACEHSLYDEYARCFIVDNSHAFCDDCISGFIALGIDPSNKLMVGM